MTIKKWSGSAWVDQYVTTNVSNIVASGTPSSTTFLRGDGQWATPIDTNTNNYVSSATFDGSTLTLNRQGLTALTVDLSSLAGGGGGAGYGLKLSGTITANQTLESLFESSYDTNGIDDVIGSYWVVTAANATVTFITTSQQHGSSPGIHYCAIGEYFEENDATGSFTLERHDWLMITSYTGSGTGGNPYVVKFSVINNTYTAATATQYGIVKFVSNTAQSQAVNSLSATSGRTYAVQKDGNGDMVVNVPWVDTNTDTNTTYTAGTGLSLTGTVFANTAPDQTVALTGAGSVSVSGTYPNFTITGTDTNTTYGIATSTTAGIVEVFSDTDQSVAANAVSATAGRTYGIQLNSANQMVVNVPWVDTNTNTTYTAGSGLSLAGTVFSHTDTSSQGSVNNSGATVIQDVTLDTYGHTTGLASVTITPALIGAQPAGSYLTGNQTITLSGDASGSGTTSIGVTVNRIDGVDFRNGNSSSGTNPDNINENGHSYINSVSLFGQSDGALYSQAYSTSWVHQIYGDYRTGQLAVRGRNNGTLTGWRNVWDSGNFNPSSYYLASNPNGYTSNVGDITGVTAGSGISGGGTSGTVTISHADTSSAANLTAGSRTYVTALTFDTYGHVTGYSTGTETVVNTDTNTVTRLRGTTGGTFVSGDITLVPSGATSISQSGNTITISSTDTNTNTTYSAGGGLTLSGTTFSHTDTSAQGSLTALTGANVVSDIDVDGYGHVTSMATRAMTAGDIGAATSSHTHSNYLPIAGSPYYSPVANSMLIYNTTYGWLTTAKQYDWNLIRNHTNTFILDNTGAFGTTGGSTTVTVGVSAGDVLMMELSPYNSVIAGYTVPVIIFRLGGTDTTPTNTQQTQFIMDERVSSTTRYQYNVKISGSSTTIYFDDSFRMQYLDTSTAASIMTEASAGLYVGKIWRLEI